MDGAHLCPNSLGSNDSEDPAIVRTRVAGLMKRALEEVPGVNLAIENMVSHSIDDLTISLTIKQTGRCKGETSASLRNLKAIIDEVDMPGRLKVCLDICHVYISQYDLYDEACADDFLEDIAELGPENIAAMHVSDSYVPHGSKRDEHAW
jgi:endonuclease IV